MQILVSIGCILRSGNVPTLNINAIWSESIESYLNNCVHNLNFLSWENRKIILLLAGWHTNVWIHAMAKSVLIYHHRKKINLLKTLSGRKEEAGLREQQLIKDAVT